MASFQKIKLKSGEVRYRFWIRRRGVSLSRRFATKEAGEQWARETESAIIDGRFQSGSSLRFTKLIDMYLERVVAGWERAAKTESELLVRERLEKRASVRRVHLDWWYGFFGRTPLHRLDPVSIAQGKEALIAKGKAPSTVNSYLSALSAVLRWASHPEQQLLRRNPVQDVERLREPPPRAQPVPREEIVILKEAARKHSDWRLYPAFLIGLCNGARRRTLETLRWSQIGFDEGVVIFPHHKAGGRAVRAPLSEEALEALHRIHRVHRTVGVEWVFWAEHNPRKPCKLGKAWEEVREATGLEVRWHDATRATAATWLHEAGADAYDLMEICGWRTVQTPQRYIRVSDLRKRELVRRAHETSDTTQETASDR
jgi:integrase